MKRHEVRLAVERARRAQPMWARVSLEQRVALLTRFGRALREREAVLVERLHRETGRPLWECAREAQGIPARLDHVVRQLAATVSPMVDREGASGVASRPLGVVGILGPAMLPIGTAHTHVAAALAAGNTVVLKPSVHGTEASLTYAEAGAAAGLPSGALEIVCGDDQLGELLVEQPIDALVFTGRSEHGRALRRRLADRLEVQLVLHLGAKNSAVVLADADLELAAYEIVTSAFLTSGQRCTALTRVMVDAQVAERLVGLVVHLTRRLRHGHPARAFLSPMLSPVRRDHFEERLAALTAQGVESILTNEPLDGTAPFITPSVHVVDDPLAAARYLEEELFGPDLAIVPVAGAREAFELADRGPYGLCSALFTQDPDAWGHFCDAMHAGTLVWNRGTTALSARLPFGGVKASGSGGRGGADALRTLTRGVSLQCGVADPPEIFPGTLDEDAPSEELPS
jgi:succinylglutamic semialdehyde dehydrogenase